MHARTRRLILPTVLLLAIFLASQAVLSSATGTLTTANAAEIASQGKLSEKPGLALARLAKDTGGQVRISISQATNVARFISFQGGAASEYALAVNTKSAAEERALAFLNNYGAAFGLASPATDLRLLSNSVDTFGARHLSYEQVVGGVPVFAGVLRVHFTPAGELSAINGTIIPDVRVRNATLTQAQAEAIALRSIKGNSAVPLSAVNTRLVVYRSNLAQGKPGANTLAYVTQVTNKVDLREFIAIDAVTGKLVDQYSLIESGLTRRLYEPTYDPDNPNATLRWKEGDAFPAALTDDQQSIVQAAGDSYYLFFNTFGRDSYDAAGAAMLSVNNQPADCPNASWNGIYTSYCLDVTTDDIVAHEWGHAYTEYTSDLIYLWQPGALNESFSDIWGETVDLLNGRGLDAPVPVRTDGVCSQYSPSRLLFQVQAPSAIAGNYPAVLASFGPTSCDVTDEVALANDDAAGTTHLACGTIANAAAINGKIALVDRGSCDFTVKVKNAQDAGAVAVLVANNVPNGLPSMSGSNADVTIPSAGITQDAGQKIRARLAANETITVRLATGQANSYRWLQGEDSGPLGFNGAIRDMANPDCYGDPRKVTDLAYYVCSIDIDGGGVHINSGIPNRLYAILVDGGTFNGQTITGIGLTKAAHIHYRAQKEYLVPSSDFSDHADALETSCADLVTTGANLPGFSLTSAPATPSGQTMTAADCAELAKAILAVELRTAPSQCAFTALLNPAAPGLCAGASDPIFADDFEGSTAGWTVEHTDVYSATLLDWQVDSSLPGGRTGKAFYADGDGDGQCNAAIGDTSRVMHLTSPAIELPASFETMSLAFDHYVATEGGFDGGNLQISVNGGAFVLVDPEDFSFNSYNTILKTAAQDNTNPLAGQPGFSGTDGGKVDGSWGQSQVDLAAYAEGGDSIKLRYRFGADGCGGADGWYVDNVKVFSCDVGSTDAILNSLSLSVGSLTPSFNPATLNYTAVVSNSVTSISVTGTLSDTNATLRINGTTVVSGTASAPIALNVGANVITVEVTAEDGTTIRTYTITVTRSSSTAASIRVYLPIVRR